MSKPAVVSGRVTIDTASMLDRLSTKLDRSRGWVVARAVERYVASELELLDSLDAAEAQIERGEFHTQEQVEAWFLSRYDDAFKA